MVVVESELPVGELVAVRITGAMAYDLSGIAETLPVKSILSTIR
jgi:hypothetical protein